MKTMTRIGIVLMAAGCAGPELPAEAWYQCTASSTPDHPEAERYQRLVDDALTAGTTAVSVAVIDDHGLWAGAGGMADLEQQIPAAPCHRFYFASVTKTFAASTALRLDEDDVWSLDDQAVDYLPEEVIDKIANLDIDDPKKGVTLRHLLQHTSGIPDYLSAAYFMEAFNGGLTGDSAAGELEWAYNRAPMFAPGEDFEYSNANYLLLSLAIEEATGAEAYDVVHKMVTTPLGLTDTLGRSENPNAIARGYADMHGNGVLMDHTELTESVMLGAGKLDGGLVSTPTDVANLLHALSDDTLLQTSSFLEMSDFFEYEPGEDDGPEDGYGLGLARIKTDHGIGWGHYGGVYPYQSAAFHFPERNTTVVVVVSGYTEDVTDWINGQAIYNTVF
ncbi:MAG: serine hydrolase domain-containing protein [Myxococcota bacterium]